MRQESAQTLALQALAFLAARDDPFTAFLSLSGTDPATLRARAAEPEVLAAVLDFLLADEALLVAFCQAEALPFEAPARARASLPGGDLPHWT